MALDPYGVNGPPFAPDHLSTNPDFPFSLFPEPTWQSNRSLLSLTYNTKPQPSVRSWRPSQLLLGERQLVKHRIRSMIPRN